MRAGRRREGLSWLTYLLQLAELRIGPPHEGYVVAEERGGRRGAHIGSGSGSGPGSGSGQGARTLVHVVSAHVSRSLSHKQREATRIDCPLLSPTVAWQ